MRRLHDERESGFTLIELMVVIAIISILSAIAIPTFLHQVKKGYRAGATQDMKNAATAVETYATEHDGSYLPIDGADQDSEVLDHEGFNNSKWIELEVIATVSSYCIQGRHAKFRNMELVFRSATGVVQISPADPADCTP